MDDLFLIKYIEMLCVSINSSSKIISLNISMTFKNETCITIRVLDRLQFCQSVLQILFRTRIDP